jgi:hypothetical protein
MKPRIGFGKSSLTPPMIALASMAVIVVTAAVALIVRYWVTPPPPDHDDYVTPSPAPSVFKAPSPSPTSIRPEELIENAARQLMRRISNDSQAYSFPDASPIREIKDAVGQCCKSARLAAALQTISQNRNEFIRLAGNQIKPDLLAYAVLAETNGGAYPSNPVNTARAMGPKLISLRNTFGDETTDSVLIFVSAYPEGVFPKGGHPLLERIPGDNPMQDRKVWSLARRNRFKPGQYEFVLRFIAYGIIADNPAQCGIQSPKLDF